MTAAFWQKGTSVDFVNETEDLIPANTVISLGTRIGITGTDILPGSKGALIVEGVFILEKKNTSDEFKLGDEVYFDGEGIVKTSDETTPAGWAIEASSNGDSNVYVKLIG